MKNIYIFDQAGVFAENKDIAQKIRLEYILPSLSTNSEIILDFAQVEGTTQSFIHALISDAIRQFGTRSLELISFKNCNPVVQKIISIVCDYMQQRD